MLSDPVLRLALGLALLANLSLYAYVWTALPSLPDLMPLHYNGAGVVDLIGGPSELLKLPAIGTLVLVVNSAAAAVLYSTERPAAHILAWTSVIVQIVFGSGVWLLVSKAAGE